MTNDTIIDLGDALRDTIDTYLTGHEIPVALVVGLLHCIAHEIIMDSDTYDLEDDDDDC